MNCRSIRFLLHSMVVWFFLFFSASLLAQTPVLSETTSQTPNSTSYTNSLEEAVEGDHAPVEFDFVWPYWVELGEVTATYLAFYWYIQSHYPDPEHRSQFFKALNIGTGVGTGTALSIVAATWAAIHFSGATINEDAIEISSAISKAATVFFLQKLVWKLTRRTVFNPLETRLGTCVTTYCKFFNDHTLMGIIMSLTTIRDVLELGLLNVFPQTESDNPNAVIPSGAVGLVSFATLIAGIYGVNKILANRGVTNKAYLTTVLGFGMTALASYMAADWGSIIAGLSGLEPDIALSVPLGLVSGLILSARVSWFAKHAWTQKIAPDAEMSISTSTDEHL